MSQHDPVYPKLGIQIQKSIEKYNIEIPQLKTVHSVITIKAVPDIFKNGKLKLRCLATMFTLYRRTEELEVLEDAPLLALIMVPTTQSSEGQLSEEAQEARNKNNRKYKELFTRKTSRIETNTDLLHRLLLITSDHFIASLRAPSKTRHGKITPEVFELLEMPSCHSNVSKENIDFSLI
ncbi:hypothetical protein ILUMI_02292 [Ignelater luminosus]|uniref:Uncharacterized protein n=1 Tax=Ignelater luminosus TaxID=2038154 RepID=A0A8K0DGR3_IGNLU|nr:hypothetical protein ILUMI_02292 [Ignelater luminosus]